ncbi:MAG: hypothetical protein QM764_00685 [Chitinophagaceae bacterium]
MDKKTVSMPEEKNSLSATKSVTVSLLNTHCIVCGSAFQVARASKLYCSTRCKQFGYNHKDQINDILTSKQRCINPETHVFFIEDYHDFIKIQKMIKRQSTLRQKQTRWENAQQEINAARQYNTDASSYSWNIFLKEGLTEDEDGELYDAEMKVDERLWGLKSRELSIEHWSFLKALYPELDKTSFIEAINGLSNDFYEQLSLELPEKINHNSVIRNKYVNHCNMIAEGNIRLKAGKTV